MSTDFRVGAWLVQPSLNTVSRNGASVHLQPKVMEVLVSLARQPGEAVPKDQLLKTVWPDTFVTDDVLIRSISELRRVFEDDAREPHIIQTIPKRGYRLVANVEPANGATGTSAGLEGSRTESSAEKRTRNRWLGVGAFAGAAFLLVVLIASSGKIQRWLSAGSSIPSIHSIAVLPLQNLSGDATQEYFSDGLTDALITDLAQIGSLKVISRTSTMNYKKTSKPLPDIARELNVDAIVEGTVQRSGDRVRITAQLIYGQTDKHVWANSYERDARDVFALERERHGGYCPPSSGAAHHREQNAPFLSSAVESQGPGGVPSRQLVPMEERRRLRGGRVFPTGHRCRSQFCARLLKAGLRSRISFLAVERRLRGR